MTSKPIVIGEYAEFIYCGCGCGKTRSKYRVRDGMPAKYINHHSPEGRVKKGQNNKQHPSFKEYEVRLNESGYLMRKDHKLIHRVIYEKAHQVCLLTWIHLHHKNGITTDNRIENLEPLTRAEHIRKHIVMLHYQKRKKWLEDKHTTQS